MPAITPIRNGSLCINRHAQFIVVQAILMQRDTDYCSVCSSQAALLRSILRGFAALLMCTSLLISSVHHLSLLLGIGAAYLLLQQGHTVLAVDAGPHTPASQAKDLQAVVVSAYKDNTVRLWDCASGQCLGAGDDHDTTLPCKLQS